MNDAPLILFDAASKWYGPVLGLNQVIMMAFGVVVIASLVGTGILVESGVRQIGGGSASQKAASDAAQLSAPAPVAFGGPLSDAQGYRRDTMKATTVPAGGTAWSCTGRASISGSTSSSA